MLNDINPNFQRRDHLDCLWVGGVTAEFSGDEMFYPGLHGDVNDMELEVSCPGGNTAYQCVLTVEGGEEFGGGVGVADCDDGNRRGEGGRGGFSGEDCEGEIGYEGVKDRGTYAPACAEDYYFCYVDGGGGGRGHNARLTRWFEDLRTYDGRR